MAGLLCRSIIEVNYPWLSDRGDAISTICSVAIAHFASDRSSEFLNFSSLFDDNTRSLIGPRPGEVLIELSGERKELSGLTDDRLLPREIPLEGHLRIYRAH